MPSTKFFTNLEDANNFIFANTSKHVHCATPLGLGKPNQLLNLIYQTAKKDPSIQLKISTALSLEVPHPHVELEKNFIGPYAERHFGKDYPELDYVLESKDRKIPSNISVHEFYMQAAQNMNVESAQRNYTSLNYTHVAQNLFDENLDVIVQLIAEKKHPVGESTYSLSCNPDLTLDVADLFDNAQKKVLIIGVVHPDLPFMGGDAEVGPEFFDAIVNSEQVKHKLFALPQTPLDTVDFMLGIHASQFLQDEGTIQIGIGSLADAIVHATLLRHAKNDVYKNMIEKIWNEKVKPKVNLFTNTFEKGLYGTSELVTDAFMHLRKAGILKREIFDVDQKLRRYLHGAFFLGSNKLYEWLFNLSEVDRAGFSMTRVSKVNDLYDNHEQALRRQRQKACFFNTCMCVDLLGGAASETLPSGQVVSGVGGQYNFVAMARELPDSRSILMLRSTHTSRGVTTSSIDWAFAHLTIPRHLRDVVVTEYGIASLRGKTDEEVICALIEIADSRFQDDLVKKAKKLRKIKQTYEVPVWARNNYLENIKRFLNSYPAELFLPFPFGTDFTPVEQRLALSLPLIKAAQPKPLKLIQMLMDGIKADKKQFQPELQRMQLDQRAGVKAWVYKNLVTGALTRL
ncbi:MAG: acetyl-CoA hydrolase [Bdellovibrio sp.]|nr:acetyl-CoA hydrolase [Bdellovibrio sp.]